jgi:hypothetical protein
VAGLSVGPWWGGEGALGSGADPTIAHADGTTPMAMAKQPHDRLESITEGRRACVAALEVRSWLAPSISPSALATLISLLVLCVVQEAERAYLLWKTRQLADQEGSGAVAVVGSEEGEEGEGEEGAGGVRAEWPEGGLVSGADGADMVRGGGRGVAAEGVKKKQ